MLEGDEVSTISLFYLIFYLEERNLRVDFVSTKKWINVYCYYCYVLYAEIFIEIKIFTLDFSR